MIKWFQFESTIESFGISTKVSKPQRSSRKQNESKNEHISSRKNIIRSKRGLYPTGMCDFPYFDLCFRYFYEGRVRGQRLICHSCCCMHLVSKETDHLAYYWNCLATDHHRHTSETSWGFSFSTVQSAYVVGCHLDGCILRGLVHHRSQECAEGIGAKQPKDNEDLG